MYAAEADLTAWLAGGDHASLAPTGAAATRILTRAWETVEEHLAGYYVVDAAGLATDAAIVTALKNAQCAQVEQWLEVGEESDIAGYSGVVSAGGGVSAEAPPELAPRARRILNKAGLLSGSPLGVKLI